MINDNLGIWPVLNNNRCLYLRIPKAFHKTRATLIGTWLHLVEMPLKWVLISSIERILSVTGTRVFSKHEERVSPTFVVFHIKLDLSGWTFVNKIILWCFVSTNIWVLHACHGREGQMRVLDTWELKLQKVINSHVGAGSQTEVSLVIATALNSCTVSLASN